MDVSLSKSVRVANRVSVELYVISTNVLNHLDFTNTSLGLSYTPGWGVISSQQNVPRNMQFGARIRY